MRNVEVGILVACGLIAGPASLSGQTERVNRDSLEAMVRFLTIDPSTDASRSRFVLRESDIGLVADSLAVRLERYTGNPVDRDSFVFTASPYSEGSFIGENYVARIEGTGAAEGVVLITAHYDAIASRSPGFQNNWDTMAAPGADDNATGVAAVMELARTLPHDYYPFDILLVLFSAEELGKKGSANFPARFESNYHEKILGVVNFDMLGYRLPPPGGSVSDPVLIANYVSGWLADMIEESTSVADPSLKFRVAKPGPSNYDHGSFWEHDISAVTITEPLDEGNFIIYPYYHTVADLIESGLDFELVEELTNAATSFLSGVAAHGAAEIAILPSDLMLIRGPYVTGSRTFAEGESLGVFVRVRNVGSLPVPPEAAIRLTVSIENASGERTIFSGDLPGPGPLLSSDMTRKFLLVGSFAGGNIVRARVEVEGMADIGGNNAANASFGVSTPEGAILSHGFRPNPIEGTFRSASFCVNLAREADIEVELYTIEGERVAAGHAGSRWGSRLEAGLNCLSCADLFAALRSLASGVYLYRLRAIENDGGITRAAGRFAVAH